MRFLNFTEATIFPTKTIANVPDDANDLIRFMVNDGAGVSFVY